MDAMKRELIEETSIRNIKIIKQIEQTYQYQLPIYKFRIFSINVNFIIVS